MAPRKINNSIKNKEDLTHLRGMALEEATWNTLETEEESGNWQEDTHRRQKRGLWCQILERIEVILKVH